MLTNEEIGILFRVFDKANDIYNQSMIKNDEGKINPYDFIDRLYFFSSINSISIALNKDFHAENSGEIDKFFIKNRKRLEEETFDSRNEITALIERVRNSGYREGRTEGQNAGFVDGYQAARQEAIKDVNNLLSLLKEVSFDFSSGYEDGLIKSHFHIACDICNKPIHVDENGPYWAQVQERLQETLSEEIENKCRIHPENEYPSLDPTDIDTRFASESYKIGFLMGQEQEHLRFACKDGENLVHFDQLDMDWAKIKNKISSAFPYFHHDYCGEKYEKQSQENQYDADF